MLKKRTIALHSWLAQFKKENYKRSMSASRDLAEILEGQQADAEWTLLEFAMPGLERAWKSITRRNVQANNFKIKPALLQMI